MDYLKNWLPACPMKKTYSYSHLGYGILGECLAYVEEESYMEVIRQLILEPLKMTSTSIHVPEKSLNYYAQGFTQRCTLTPHRPSNLLDGANALRSTSGDMLKFLEANLGERTPISLILAMGLAQKSIFKVDIDFSIGLGWERYKYEGQLIIEQDGGGAGFSSYIGMLPKQKIGIVLLANKGKINIKSFGRHLLMRLVHCKD